MGDFKVGRLYMLLIAEKYPYNKIYIPCLFTGLYVYPESFKDWEIAVARVLAISYTLESLGAVEEDL